MNWDKINASPKWEELMLKFNEIMDNVYFKFYEQFFPTRFDSIYKRINEIDQELVKNEAAGTKLLNDFIETLENEKDRNSIPATEKDIRAIHAAKGQKKMGEQEYRELLVKLTGKNSSKDMKHYEAQVVLRGILSPQRHEDTKDTKTDDDSLNQGNNKNGIQD